MKKNKYYIEKVLNNNSLVVKTSNKDSKILFGKGIGYKKKSNTCTIIHGSMIEKSFFNYDETLKNQLINIISYIDEKIVEVSNEIIALAEAEFGKLNQHVYVSLTDHISFALERLKNGEMITNSFLSNIKLLLNKEYEIAKKAKEIIHTKLNITIPEEEIGFIAFHINAARENVKANFVVLEMRLYKETIKLIENCINNEIDPDLKVDLYYIIQLITKNQSIPFKFLIKNLSKNNRILDNECQKMITNIYDNIEKNINTKLTNDQKNILSYVLYTTRNED